MGMAILGTRITFSMPLDLKCNWIFRMISLPKTLDWLGGARRALLLIGVSPLVACAASFFWIWPWRPTFEHLMFLALIGAILVDCSLYGFRKIPFTMLIPARQVKCLCRILDLCFARNPAP